MLTKSQIQHVFVLMLENHSFDNMLGFSGISGTDAVSGQRRTVPQPSGSNPYDGVDYPITDNGLNPMPNDPGHEFTDTVVQLGGPGATYPQYGPYPPIVNTGFATSYATQKTYGGTGTPDDPLRCYGPDQVPVVTALASEFVLCDSWFSSMPGPTWPNRYFVHAASSGGLDHSPTTADIAYYMAFGYSFQNGTIYDRLESLGMPWRIYHGDAFPQALSLKNMTRYDIEGHYSDYADFAGDVASGYQPVYTFIEPSYGAISSDYTCGSSQHPLDDVTRGEWLVKCTYEAIRNSPVWDTSLLVVTWDEHGGFYDHVAPTTAPPPADNPTWPKNNESGFPFNLYGVRVPAIVVSPWTAANVLDGRTYDHTTILATIERLYGIPPMTQRDTNALDLRSLGTLSSPRTDAPTSLPDPGPIAVTKCDPVTDCMQLPSTVATHRDLLAATPAPDEPLEGTQAGFVQVALQRDLAVSPPAEHEARRAQAAAVTTKEQARQYFVDVADRVVAARGGT
jgi:phospholipase C